MKWVVYLLSSTLMITGLLMMNEAKAEVRVCLNRNCSVAVGQVQFAKLELGKRPCKTGKCLVLRYQKYCERRLKA